jgi:hypothetical protein
VNGIFLGPLMCGNCSNVDAIFKFHELVVDLMLHCPVIGFHRCENYVSLCFCTSDYRDYAQMGRLICIRTKIPIYSKLWSKLENYN